ncbi:MAG: protein translocase subunit SecD [Candidatus Kapaibacteriota bacterium]
MNRKNLSRWLLIFAPLLAVAYLLWPTYRFYQLDAERSSLASDSAALEAWDVQNAEDYQTARLKRIKLGLDLRGGMYVTLEVDVLKLIEESADKLSIDDDFMAVLEETRKETDNTDKNVLDVFLEKFRAKAATNNMSLLQYFTVSNQLDPTEEAIEEKLRKDVDEAIDQALQVISQRINKYDVSEANIQKQGARRILLELPDVKDENEIRSLLQTTARLEFHRVTMGRPMIETFYAIDALLRGDVLEEPAEDTTAVADTATVAAADSTVADTAKADTAKADTTNPYAGLSDDEALRRIKKDYPFTYMISGVFAPNAQASFQAFDFTLKKAADFPETGVYRFVVGEKFVSRFLAIMDRPDVQRLMPVDLKILVGAKPERQQGADAEAGFFDIYGVAADPELTGDVVTEAFPSFDPQNNQPVVIMDMNSEGAERWASITAANINKQIAIVLDGRVYSAPNVQGKIPDGRSQITGMGNTEEANLLAVVLKAGALKAPVKIIEERVVGPSLGEDSIRRGITSSILSFALVILFMLVYYMMGGGLADIALMMNVLLVVAGLAGFGGTLTLPGIAGIILATAMAVDANILIFERIREEMAMGKPLRSAVEQGYAKAWSAILDSNITNMLSGIVLIFLGTGPVKGFAVTLIIGVLMTLFTAVVLTRAMFEIMISSGATSINLGQKKTASA